LWIGSIFETGAAPRIGLASQQEFLEALRSPESIDAIQYLEHGCGAQLECTMSVRVKFGCKATQFAKRARHLQPLRQGIDELDATSFVPRVFGQNIFRGSRFSQVMNERGEANVRIC
jgi:hypothetical protein